MAMNLWWRVIASPALLTTMAPLMELLFAPFLPLLIFPYLALGPAMVFAGLAWWTSSRFCAATSMTWLLYTAYEAMMYHRILCTGECNIRVDLLLIFPFLFLITIWAILAAVAAARKKPQ
jgi:hypothetical protein